MKKKYPAPKGKIEYERLKKKIDLIKLCADFYLLYTMKNLAEDRLKNGERFLKSREKFLKDLEGALQEVTEDLEKLFLAYFPIAVISELQNKDEIKASEKKIEQVSKGFLEEIPEDKDELLKYLEKEVSSCEKALEFFGMAKSAFGKLKWESGYGGKKWADIADTAHMRLSGDIDSIVFLDRAFDIQHHGGHIFDKCEHTACSDEELNSVLTIKSASSLEKIKKFTKKYASKYVDGLFKRGNVFKLWEEEDNGTEKK